MIRLCRQAVIASTLMVLCCHSWAATYDPLLLRAQASIFPKIILLDKDLAKKSPGKLVVLSIVSTRQDRNIAQQLQSAIKSEYGNKLGNKNLVINMTTFKDINQDSLATAYIVLQGSKSEFKKVVAKASSNSRIIFSYNYADFKYNALISLHVKEKTYIYLNKPSFKLYNIKFSPIFYNLTKIIE